MGERRKVFLSLSLDVEEEGLFGGVYDCLSPSISNTASLRRLGPFLERGVKPTLFCAYAAFADPVSRKILEDLRDRHGAAIGAHLHHWNTPPLVRLSDGTVPEKIYNVASGNVEYDQLAAKMNSLFRIARDFQGEPVRCFRMGRWDLRRPHWELLEANGVNCDASVRPLHRMSPDGPNHFHAPMDPYIATKSGIMEIPLTVTPLHPSLATAMKRMPKNVQENYQSLFRKWGALALLPVEHPLWLLKWTTRLHIMRGGKNLSLAWHSSEMMPGGAPHMPTAEKIEKFLAKMIAYIDWLQKNFTVAFTTIPALREAIYSSLPAPSPEGECDWSAIGHA